MLMKVIKREFGIHYTVVVIGDKREDIGNIIIMREKIGLL